MVAALAADVLAGLGHAHEAGILHRDIKPGNILITESGVAKLADFGIAKATEETVDLTDSGAILGTVSYASPEQLSGGPLGPASDLYSLACVLYECLAGSPPFVADNIAALVSQQQFATPDNLRDLLTGVHHPRLVTRSCGRWKRTLPNASTAQARWPRRSVPLAGVPLIVHRPPQPSNTLRGLGSCTIGAVLLRRLSLPSSSLPA